MTRVVSKRYICTFFHVLLLAIVVTGTFISDDEDDDVFSGNDAGLFESEEATNKTFNDVYHWSSWTSWSQCSRSCGIGISTSTRTCEMTRPYTNEPCLGKNRRYRTCETQDCDDSAADFRQIQCANLTSASDHDDEGGGGLLKMADAKDLRNVTNFNQCSLYCRLADGSGEVRRTAEKVIDGTRCYVEDQYGVCIDGSCEEVGCNKELNGKFKFDKCGVCGGDSSTCQLITGIVHPTFDRNTTELVVEIPIQSRKIIVSGEMDFDITTGDSNSSLLNTEQNNLSPLDDAVEPFSPRKVYKLDGPLASNARIMVKRQSGRKCPFLQGCPLDHGDDKPDPAAGLGGGSGTEYIRYEYYRPRTVMWIYNDTSAPCSATCGSGFRYVNPICIAIETLQVFPDSTCTDQGLPPASGKVRPCLLPLCQAPGHVPPESSDTMKFYHIAPVHYEYVKRPMWHSSSWTRCSVSCGGGVQTRAHSCVEKYLYQDEYEDVPDTVCSQLPIPENMKTCNTFPCSTWYAGPWSSCSVSCGHGFQRRVIVCENENMNQNIQCNVAHMPSNRRKCYTPCKAGAIAQMFAGTNDNPEDGDDNIPALIADKNAASSSPTAVGALKPRWVVEKWSACSRTCGRGGVQFRMVKCILKHTDPSRATEQVSEDRCTDEKPFNEKECLLGLCPSPSMGELNRAPATATQTITINMGETMDLYKQGIYIWKHEAWRSCSVTCGIGVQISIAQCYHRAADQLSAEDRCDPNTKLSPRVKSCGGPCLAPAIGINGSRWDIGLYGECSKTCGRGTRERKVVCKFIPENEEEISTRTEEIMPEIMCPYPKPTQSEPCGLSSCPPKWVLTDWGKCSKTCGGGVQEKKRECRQLTGMGETITVSPMFCPKNIPKKRKYCHLGDCPPRYVAERWGPCRPPCIKGQGTQRRKVACKRMHKRRFILLPAKHCKRLQKPPSQRRCNLGPKCFSSLDSSSTSALPSRPPRPRLFVQHKRRKSPIYLTLPRRAVVFPGTTVIGACGFKGVPPKNIQWFHKRRKLTPHRGRVMVTATGSLRLNRVRARSAGAYRCTDGKSQSKFFVVQLRGSKTRAAPRRSELMKIDDVADESSHHYGSFIQTLTPLNRKHELVDQPSAGPNIVIKSAADTRWRQQISSSYNIGGGHPPSKKKNKPHRPYGRKYEFEYDYDNGLPDIISARSNYLGFKRRPVVKGPAFGASEEEDVAEEEALNIESEKKSPSIEVHPTIDPLQTSADIVTHVGGSLVVVGSQRVTILCEATGELPIEYEWYKDERKINNDDRLIKLQDGSLRIFQPQYTDAGRFVCVAHNQYGNDSRATVISVTNKPNILSTTEQVEDFVSQDLVVTVGSHIRAKLGARIVIRCPTEGFPEPYVEWRKDGPGLLRNSRTLKDNSLELYPTSTADQGLFSCEATNPFGTSYQASSLVLIDPPHVSLDDKVIPDSNDMDGLPELLNTDESNPEYRVKANSSVIMGCPLAGFPEPEIEWFYEGEKITNFGELLDFQLMFKNKVLQIPMANNHSVGIYSCKGTNDGGAAEISLRLNITVYKWALNGLTQCSESCGNSGTQRYQLVCMEDGIRQVEDWYCTGIEQPEFEEIPCNRVDCPPRYYAEPWSNCSVTCGKGTRTRSITCVVLMVDGSMREVSRASCETETPVPSEEESCVEDPCPMWRTGEWRKCSKKCTGNGTGLTTRSVQCVSHNGTVVHKSMCKHLPKPDKKQNCTNQRCNPVWRPSPWSVCSTSCGRSGIQTRILGCYYEGRQNQSAGRRCLAATRPPVSQPCNRRSCSRSKSKMRCRDRARICRRALVDRRLPMCLNLKKRCCRTCS